MKIKKKNENILDEKGMNSIELAIITLMAIMCICALLDLTNIMKKQNAISTTANYITRVVGKQGGVREVKPEMYPGEYITSQQLYEAVRKNMLSAGIDETDWTVRITVPGNSVEKLTSHSNFKLVTHGQPIKIQLEAHYNWTMLSQVIPMKPTGSNVANRETDSKFKVRELNEVQSSIE